jgi:hypothetical protein
MLIKLTKAYSERVFAEQLKEKTESAPGIEEIGSFLLDIYN